MLKKSLLLFLLFVVWGVPVFTQSQAASQSTSADQKNVEVTVYNSNLALVKDQRNVNLSKGQGELRFMDVAAFIMPESVHVSSLNAGDQFNVLEQNYEYDLMDYGKLLSKYVGKDIKLLYDNPYQDRKDVVDAQLLSYNNNQPVYKIGDEIHLGYPGYQILPQVPENLIAKPTLTWLYDNNFSDSNELEVSYLTTNLSWKADYVLVLDQKDAAADLSGWVTVDNQSGAGYENASLKLVAGDVNRVNTDVYQYDMMEMKATARGASAPQFEEKGFFEYHIYDLQRRTDLKNNQTKQISLLEAAGVNIKKEFITNGNQDYYYSQYQGNDIKQAVEVTVRFDNKKENALGMPLPKGIVRLYKEDEDKKLQFIGEDNIEHTPKDEEVKIRVGEAFDVVAQRKQTDFKQLTSRQSESEWEITLRNHKEEDVTVKIIEPVHGNWVVVSNSHPYKKEDAFTLSFEVSVPKDQEVVVKYRVKIGY